MKAEEQLQLASRKIVGIACVAAVLALGALLGAAPAGAANAPTKVIVIAGGPFGTAGKAGVVGVVTSPNRRCLDGRRIEVSLVKPGGVVALDVARSGKNGGWYARGPASALAGATAVRVKLAKRKIGKGPDALRCGGATVELS